MTEEARQAMLEGRTILCFANGYDAPPMLVDNLIQEVRNGP
jgi:hypothetical protein